MKKPKLIRITTSPISLQFLLGGQMRYMSENGFDVIMVSADGKERDALIEQEGCPHFIVPMTRAITPIQDLKCLWQLVKLMRKEKPDIVHTHTPKAGLLGMLAAKLTRVPVKFHTIAGLPLMTASPVKKYILLWIERLTYWAADNIFPNSKSLKKYIIEEKILPIKKLEIIGEGSSNGINLSYFSPIDLDDTILNDIKSLIEYKSDKFYFTVVGRMVKDKGIIEIIEAFCDIHKKYPHSNLILVGPYERIRSEETLPNELIKIIEEHSAIYSVGFSDYVRYFLALSNVLLHASYREGFPNVLLQAGSMNCPIICSNIPGNIDIVSDKSTGLLFEVKNRNSLFSSMVYSLESSSNMTEYAKKLNIKIKSFFDQKYIHEKIFDRYHDAMKNNKRIPSESK